MVLNYQQFKEFRIWALKHNPELLTIFEYPFNDNIFLKAQCKQAQSFKEDIIDKYKRFECEKGVDHALSILGIELHIEVKNSKYWQEYIIKLITDYAFAKSSAYDLQTKDLSIKYGRDITTKERKYLLWHCPFNYIIDFLYPESVKWYHKIFWKK